MSEAVTPPNPAGSGIGRVTPDPTLLTIDSIRREIAMLENLFDTRLVDTESLNKERFHSVDQLMERSEEQRKEQKADTKAAVDAALASQKEATTKMEKSISDQIASLRVNVDTEVRSLRASAADNKQALAEIRATKTGLHDQKVEQRAVTSGQLAALGSAITVGMILVSIVAYLLGT